jgi:hypothetical protein
MSISVQSQVEWDPDCPNLSSTTQKGSAYTVLYRMGTVCIALYNTRILNFVRWLLISGTSGGPQVLHSKCEVPKNNILLVIQKTPNYRTWAIYI